MSWSSADGVLAYLRERFPLHMFLPVVLFLALALGADARLDDGASLALITMLVFQFRLLDDLGDLETDRETSPGRVLSRAGRLRPYYLLSVLVVILVLFILRDRPPVAVGYLLLVTCFLVWYRTLHRSCSPVVSYHVVLLKYPAFILLAAGLASIPFDMDLFLTMGLVYATFLCYEPLHDARVRSSIHMDRILGTELVFWAAALLLVTGLGRHLVLLLVAVPVLAGLVWAWRTTSSGVVLFLMSFVALLSIHLRAVP